MSGPEPDWIAEVMRGCRSLALTVSKLIFIPSAFMASGRIDLRSNSSDAGTKSFQRIQCTVLACANTGARWEARIPAIPVAPEYCRNLRRVIRAIFSSSLRVGHDQFTTANQGQTTFFWRGKARGTRLIVQRQAKKTWSVPDLGFQPDLRTRVNKRRRVDDEFGPAAGVHRHDRADRGARDVAEQLVGPAQRVRADHDVVELEDRVVGGRGLFLEHIQTGAGDAPRGECLVQCLFVHHRAARHVDEEGAQIG